MRLKNILKIMTLILAMSLVLSGCMSKEERQTKELQSKYETAVAVVDDEPIQMSDVQKYYDLYKAQYGEDFLNQTTDDRKNSDILMEDIVNSYIQNILIKNYVIEHSNPITLDEIESEYKKFMKLLENDNNRKAQFDEIAIDDVFIKQDIENLLYEYEFKELIKNQVAEDQELLQAKYDESVVEVKARHILVENEIDAKLIKEKLDGGADFSELAMQYSIDPGTNTEGGDLGYFGKKVMLKEVEDAVFSMEIGEISEPVQSSFGYHIIKLEDKNTLSELIEKNPSSEKVKKYQEQIIEEEALIRSEREIQTLKDNADIRIFEDRLNMTAQESSN